MTMLCYLGSTETAERLGRIKQPVEVSSSGRREEENLHNTKKNVWPGITGHVLVGKIK